MSTEEKKSEGMDSAVVGALSGIAGSSSGKLFVHPIDTIKAKIQVRKVNQMTGNKSLIAHIFRDTVKNDGFLGLYRGFSISFFGTIPAAGLYFGGYEFFKRNTMELPYF